MVEKILTGVLCHFSSYDTTTCDKAALDKDNHVPDISFACFTATKLYYSIFGELVEGAPPSGLVFCSVAIIYYERYGKLVESLNLTATFKDYKKGSVNVHRKNGGVKSDWEDMKDNERDNKDFA